MTPAKRQGIVLDKTYTIVGPHDGYDEINTSSDLKIGDQVTLNEDDDSELPFFNVVGGDTHRIVININQTKLVETVTAAPAVAKPYEITVRSNEESTLFIVTRVLTKQEIAAVFALLNK